MNTSNGSNSRVTFGINPIRIGSLILLPLAILLISGCATTSNTGGPNSGWIQGQIVSLTDGVVMPMQIQKKWSIGGSATGGIAAQNPKSGEKLNGKYTAMLETVASSSTSGSGTVSSGGSTANWTGSTTTHVRSNKANSQANLVGDKGTAISFDIEIMAGWSPHGFGQGIDGQGQKYRLQF